MFQKYPKNIDINTPEIGVLPICLRKLYYFKGTTVGPGTHTIYTMCLHTYVYRHSFYSHHFYSGIITILLEYADLFLDLTHLSRYIPYSCSPLGVFHAVCIMYRSH